MKLIVGWTCPASVDTKAGQALTSQGALPDAKPYDEGVVDPIAVWGAVTGSIGASIAVRREVLARRLSVAVRPGFQYNASRKDPVGAVTHAWALVHFWNTGGRPLAVEHVGFRYFVEFDIGGGMRALDERRAEIAIDGPIELPVDGPSHKVHTPLGPMLAMGIDPMGGDVEAFVTTTGDREWFSPPQALIRYVMPPTTLKMLEKGLETLKEEAETPPLMGHLVSLKREEPYLPPDDSAAGSIHRDDAESQ